MIERWAIILTGPVMILWAVALWQGWLPVGSERRARVWHQVYDNPDHPYNRIVIAPLLFGGIGTVLVAIGSELRGAGDALAGYGAIVILAALVPYGFAMRTWFRTPAWSVPAWVHDELRRRDAGLPSALELPPGGKKLTISRREFRLGWLTAGVVTVGVVFFGWPPYLLFGVATWLSLVAIARVSGPRQLAHRTHEVYANDIRSGVRPAFDLRAERSDDGWIVTVQELAALRAVARSDDEVDAVARTMVADALDVPPDSFDLIQRRPGVDAAPLM